MDKTLYRQFTVAAVLAALVGAEFGALAQTASGTAAQAARVSISTDSGDLRSVLSGLFRKVGVSFILDTQVQGTVDLDIRDASLDQALRAVLEAAVGGPPLTYSVEQGVYRVAPVATLSKAVRPQLSAAVKEPTASGAASKPAASGQASAIAPETEWYVYPAPPGPIDSGFGGGLAVVGERALYVRVEVVPSGPVFVPTGIGTPSVPVFLEPERRVVWSGIGPLYGTGIGPDAPPYWAIERGTFGPGAVHRPVRRIGLHQIARRWPG